MTRDEARAVVAAAFAVDDGCADCAADLLRDLARDLPDVPWLELVDELRPGSPVARMVREATP